MFVEVSQIILCVCYILRDKFLITSTSPQTVHTNTPHVCAYACMRSTRVCVCVCVHACTALMHNSRLAIPSPHLLLSNYPVCVCAAGLCVWLRRFVFAYIYANKNGLFGVLPLKNLPLVQFTACLLNLMEKTYSTRRFVLGKKFGTILLTGWKKGSGKLYYGKSRLVYIQCSYAVLTNAEHQHTTAVQTYNIATGTVCTDSS